MEITRKTNLQTAISALMDSEEFLNALAACASMEQVQQLLHENNVEITLEEVAEFQAEGTELLKKNATAELSEADLDNVAGGGKLRQFGRFVVAAAGGAVIGFAAGVCPPLVPVAYGYAGVAAIWVARG